MDDTKRKLIALLAGKAHDAQMKFNEIGLRAIPQDAKEARDLRIRYELARAAVIESNDELNRAMQPEIQGDK